MTFLSTWSQVHCKAAALRLDVKVQRVLLRAGEHLGSRTCPVDLKFKAKHQGLLQQRLPGLIHTVGN